MRTDDFFYKILRICFVSASETVRYSIIFLYFQIWSSPLDAEWGSTTFKFSILSSSDLEAQRVGLHFPFFIVGRRIFSLSSSKDLEWLESKYGDLLGVFSRTAQDSRQPSFCYFFSFLSEKPEHENIGTFVGIPAGSQWTPLSEIVRICMWIHREFHKTV